MIDTPAEKLEIELRIEREKANLNILSKDVAGELEKLRKFNMLVNEREIRKNAIRESAFEVMALRRKIEALRSKNEDEKLKARTKFLLCTVCVAILAIMCAQLTSKSNALHDTSWRPHMICGVLVSNAASHVISITGLLRMLILLITPIMQSAITGKRYTSQKKS